MLVMANSSLLAILLDDRPKVIISPYVVGLRVLRKKISTTVMILKTHALPNTRQDLRFSFVVISQPILLYWGSLLMEVILAPGATEHGIGTTGNKHLMAVAAQLHRLLFIRQQEAEHHVDGKHQGMEIPNNRGLFIQGNVICGCVATKGCHTHPHGVSLGFIHSVVVQIVKERVGHIEGQILELGHQPVIPPGIFPLEAHPHRHRLIEKGHGQCDHHSVLDIPCRFYASLNQIQGTSD